MTPNQILAALTLPLALAACGQQPEAQPPADSSSAPRETAKEAVAGESQAPVPESSLPALAHESWVRGEWLKADNRSTCGPITFGQVADRGGKPRPAHFAGGWAVAFDLPDKRSAYGIAGAGVETMPEEELRGRWPYSMSLDTLPEGSFAGYGVEGAENYPADDPEGNSVKSLAYVRVAGQDCLYNVWSNLGRAHLEVMLGSLGMVETAS